MMKLSIALLSTAFLFSLTAQAKLDCWQSTTKIFDDIYVEKDGLISLGWFGDEDDEDDYVIPTCADVAKVGDKIDDSFPLLRRAGLKRPANLIINLIDQDGSPYNSGTLLNLPNQLYFDGATKMPKYTEPVWLHEYGHAVFAANLANQQLPKNSLDEEWRAQQKATKLYVNLSIDLTILAREYFQLDKNYETAEENGNSALCDRLEAKLEKISEKQERIDDQMSEAEETIQENEYLFVVGPYNELFADLLAVLVAEDTNAIYDSLRFTALWSDEDYRYSVISRSFSNRKNRLGRWVPELSVHNLFAPVRYHIGTRYFENGLYRRDQGRALILENVFNAMVSEMARLYKSLEDNVELNFSNLDDDFIEELNQKLIDAIDEEFAN